MGTPIATPSDLATLLGSDVDQVRALLVLELAQGLCETVVSPLPESAKGVVLSVALRAYTNVANATQQTVGPISASYGDGATGGLYLSRQDRAALGRLTGRGGAFTFETMPATAGQGLGWWNGGAAEVGFDAPDDGLVVDVDGGFLG